MNYSIREATTSDTELISGLAEKIWYKHYPDIISIRQINYMLEKMYSSESLRNQMNEGHRFYIISVDNDPAGYYSVSNSGKGQYFLHKLYIDTERSGTGLGSVLLKHLYDQIEKEAEIRLTVNRKNYKAINFYFKNGFKIESVEDFDIGNGYEMNDFVMIR